MTNMVWPLQKNISNEFVAPELKIRWRHEKSHKIKGYEPNWQKAGLIDK